MNNQRIIYLDYLRITAILAMIMLHVANDGFLSYNTSTSEWMTTNIYNSMVRWCVPVFVMISGSLFLQRDIPYKKLITKYVLRILTVYAVWDIAYGAYNAHINPFFDNILKGHFHLWFLPMIALLYVCQPIFRCIAKNRKIAQLFIVLCIIFVFLHSFIREILEIWRGTNELSNIQIINSANFKASEYSCYFILGYYLTNNNISRKWRYLAYLTAVTSFAITIILNYKASMLTGERISAFFGYNMISTFFISAALFLLYKSINFRDSSFYRRFIIKLSNWSLGAYLFHAFLLHPFLVKDIMALNIHECSPWWYMPFITVVIAILSYFVSAVLNQTPIVKRYIV